MSFAHNFAHGMGKFIGVSISILAWPGKALKKSAGKLRPGSTREKIRSIVTEELINLMGMEAEVDSAKIEHRLQIMAETILALQKKINELSARGPVSEADMFKAMDSLKAAESLTSDERSVLVNVFRQNVALQKPELVNTAVESPSDAQVGVGNI